MRSNHSLLLLYYALKLLAEIAIHRSISHQHIVRFHSIGCDSENYYILLEKCNNRSLRQVMKARSRVTESEVRYWISQLLSSLAYLHDHSICHRDLKLDNIFLHERQVKLGDFGFSVRLAGNATTKTFCGTPNYIAPEVVQRIDYSFPVDVWAIGVLVYTMTFGTPPFETSSATTTYEKIKSIDYAFPEVDNSSDEVKDVIRLCLQGRPDARPTCKALLEHAFFAPHFIPASLPPTALGYSGTSMSASKKRSRVAETAQIDALGAVPATKRYVTGDQNKENTSNLLRKPSTTHGQNGTPLHGAFSLNGAGAAGSPAMTPSSIRTRQAAAGSLAGTPRTAAAASPRTALYSTGNSNKQEAPISMQAVVDLTDSSPSKPVAPAQPATTTHVSSYAWDQELHEAHLTRITERLNEIAAQPAIDKVPNVPPPSIHPAEAHRLGHHWIVTWLDYSQRFGLSFQFCDGTVGVLFIDSSSLMTYPASGRMQYTKMVRDAARRVMPVAPNAPVPGSKGPIAKMVLEEFALPEHRAAIESREHMRNRVELLDYFSDYMKTKLAPSSGLAISCEPLCAVHNATPTYESPRLLGLLRWFKAETAIIFLFTNYTVQINFYDHVKLVITLPDLVENPDATELITVVSERGVGVTRTPAQMMAGGVLTSSLIAKLQFAAKVISSPLLHSL